MEANAEENKYSFITELIATVILTRQAVFAPTPDLIVAVD